MNRPFAIIAFACLIPSSGLAQNRPAPDPTARIILVHETSPYGTEAMPGF